MNDHAAFRREIADAGLSARNLDTATTCHVSAMLGHADVFSSRNCEMMEAAGCPLANETLKRLKFETMLMELSSRFIIIPAEKVDSIIETALQRMVELLKIDRSGLGEVTANGTQFVVTHSYQLPGVPPSSRLMLRTDFPTYARLLRQGQVIRMPEGLPPEAVAERECCRRIGIKSHLAIPLTITGRIPD